MGPGPGAPAERRPAARKQVQYIRTVIFMISHIFHRISYIGVRDCPYGICCPWVRGGWGLEALGKIFRRRRRRRRRRPLLFRQILENIVMFSQFSWKTDFWGHLFLRMSFSNFNFRRRHASPLGEVE